MDHFFWLKPTLLIRFEQTKEIKDFTAKGQALVRLVSQARNAKDFELMAEIIAYNRQFNAEKSALRKGKSASEASPETEDNTQFDDLNFEDDELFGEGDPETGLPVPEDNIDLVQARLQAIQSVATG